MAWVVYVVIYVIISRICCGMASLCCDICHYRWDMLYVVQLML